MTKADKAKFGEVIGVVAVACGKEINDLVLKVYFAALESLPIAYVELAGMKLIRTWCNPGQLPTPAQFLETIEGDPTLKASKALETICTAMSRSGAYKSVLFEDIGLMVTVERFGGWMAICQRYRTMRPQDVSFFEREFRQQYLSALKSGEKPRRTHEPGVFESENSLHFGHITRGLLPEQQVDCYDRNGRRKSLLPSECGSNDRVLTDGSEAEVRPDLVTK